jgi:hypothetical protein
VKFIEPPSLAPEPLPAIETMPVPVAVFVTKATLTGADAPTARLEIDDGVEHCVAGALHDVVKDTLGRTLVPVFLTVNVAEPLCSVTSVPPVPPSGVISIR